jgi:hypothetical protein
MISNQMLRPFLCVCICLYLWAAPAFAQDMAPSTGEDVALAFFKAGNAKPDFDLWAKSSKDYIVAAPVAAADILYEEKQRLMRKWRAFNAGAGVLYVEAVVDVALKTTVNKDGDEEYWMSMAFTEGDVTYFPYNFLEYDFAVYPQKIEQLMTERLQKPQYDLMFADFKNKPVGKAYLSFQLKPVRSDMEQPYEIDGKEQWVLLCDIASLSLLSVNTRQSFWSHASDWYVSPTTQKMQELYQKPAGNTAAPSIP